MAGDVSRANMSIAAGQQYDALLRDLTNVSTFSQTYSGGLSPVVAPPPCFSKIYGFLGIFRSPPHPGKIHEYDPELLKFLVRLIVT